MLSRKGGKKEAGKKLKFMEKLARKHGDLLGQESVTAVFFGDSVTQGCFEVYMKSEGCLETVFDWEESYSNKFKKLIGQLFPNAQFNVINSGISGDNAVSGCRRLERDVLRFRPDLAVVCFGLNDSTRGAEGMEDYRKALAEIFSRITQTGAECILMTPNAMCTEKAYGMSDAPIAGAAELCSRLMREGVLDRYVETAKQTAQSCGVAVCDCYSLWKKIYACGADPLDLLSNKINHPTRELHWLFAHELLRTVLSD